MDNEVAWTLKPFDNLTPHELYAIMQLRNEIFVVEQHCVYQDADGKDPLAFHLMGWLQTDLVLYTRLLPAGISYAGYSSIGRVVSSKKIRGKGYGHHLMQRSIDEIKRLFPGHDIKIGAQLYLKSFYESIGFKQVSAVYLEDDIEHIEMIRTM
jgi:ElaA protein